MASEDGTFPLEHLLAHRPRLDSRHPRWLHSLDAFLHGFYELEDAIRKKRRDPAPLLEEEYSDRLVLDLVERFNAFRAWGYMHLVLPRPYVTRLVPSRAYYAPANGTREHEIAGLKAVLEWLTPAPEYPEGATSAECRRVLELRRRLEQEARSRLSAIEQGETLTWEGPDWDELIGLPRRLLSYMARRRSADLEDLCQDVWGKDAGRVSDNAIATVISKSNAFLMQREYPRKLSRRGAIIRWR